MKHEPDFIDYVCGTIAWTVVAMLGSLSFSIVAILVWKVLLALCQCDFTA